MIGIVARVLEGVLPVTSGLPLGATPSRINLLIMFMVKPRLPRTKQILEGRNKRSVLKHDSSEEIVNTPT
ncbi:unnamed protein product [Calypogeia fissa]